MDQFDENDILFTNKFLPEPDLTGTVEVENEEEFRKFYKREMEKAHSASIKSKHSTIKDNTVDQFSIRSVPLDEETDDNNIMNTNKFGVEDLDVSRSNRNRLDGGSASGSRGISRKTRELKTYVSIDSRDRDRILYSKPNFFKIFLGKTFYNVKSIRLVSVEFPNTNAVINSTNNKIYWRNLEDITVNKLNTITGTYPVYEVDLRIGSYVSTSLQSEMNSKLGTLRRLNGIGDFHDFIVDLDLDTDIVSFTSLTLTTLGNNPLNTTVGTGIIRVTADNHGFETGDKVYIIGAKTLAGIPAATLGSYHTITKINTNEFQYEVNVKAAETARGGGNTVKTGVEAPFQFLFGENTNTVAPNIGFPIENSSELVNTEIKSIANIHLAQITIGTSTFISSLVGQTCTLTGTSVTPDINGTRLIAQVLNPTTLTVIINSNLTSSSYNTGSITIGGDTYLILAVEPYNIETVLITTFTPHNFAVADAFAKTVTLSDTITTPVLDGTFSIYGVPSDTELIIPGNLLPGGETNVSEAGTGGKMTRSNPLETYTVPITNIIPGAFTTFTCISHNLKAGDTIRFYNVKTTPPLKDTVYIIYSVPTPNTFLIDFATTSFVPDTVFNNEAYIGTQIMKMSLPGHGFNTITSLANNHSPKTITQIESATSGGIFRASITTATPHLLNNGDTVTISGANCLPDINGSGYVVTVISPNEITVPITGDIVSDGNTGTVVLSTIKLRVSTFLPHNLETGDSVRIMQTTSIPTVNGYYTNITKVSNTEFDVSFLGGTTVLTSPGTAGIIGMNHEFYIYGAERVGGISPNDINNILYTVREIVDENTFKFTARGCASSTERGGGDGVYISSLFHGFAGVQTNTKNSLLNRSINLEGENYAFLCCPQLATMMNTGKVQNVFGRITLDQSPGSMVFTFLSTPKEYDTALLDQLNELEFSIVNYDNTLYEFNDLDYSFVLEVTEIKDVTDQFNFSSKRGTTETI